MKKFFSSHLFIAELIVFAFFLPNLLQGKYPIPADSLLGLYHPFRDQSTDGYAPGKFPTKNPLITDPVLQTYPWRNLTVENIKDGNLPLWNPYSFSGQPLLANIQSAPFQITNILFFIFPFNFAWALQVILPTILTAVFMYLFLKEINLSKLASTFGAIVLPFSGFFMAWMTWGTIVSTAMWLPLLLLCLEKLSKRISPLWFLILIFSISQVIFGGHFQTALYTQLAAIAYLIYRFFQTKKGTFLVISTTAISLGLLLSAVQLIPSLEFINQSARNIDQAYQAGRQDWFIPISNLIQLIAPDYFGNPATYNYWGVWNYAEFVSFVGIIPLGLVLFAIVAKNKQKKFFLLLTVVSLLLAIANPISKIPYLINLPFISSIQPSRIIFLLVFSLSALAAIGIDSFLDLKNKKTTLIFGSIIFVLLLGLGTVTYFANGLFPTVVDLDPRYIALRNLVVPLALAAAFVLVSFLKVKNVPNKFIYTIILGLTVVELFRFGYKFTPFAKSSLIFPQTKTIEFLQSQNKPFRIMTTDRRIMHPNVSSVYKIESIDGYDPLYLKDYAKFVSAIMSNNPNSETSSFNRIVTPQSYQSPLINLLNVKYILSFDTINSPELNLVFQEGETKVYENKNQLPRAFFAEEVLTVNSTEQEYTKILDETFDYSKKAASQEYSYTGKAVDSSLEITNYSDQNISIKTQTDGNKPMILTNVYYPGWKAYIDREQVPIYRADAIFQLIEVPQGEHTVEFKFRPKSFYNGSYISSLALVAALGCSYYLWRKKFQ